MLTLTRDLTEAQRATAEARALKKCRFGRQHSMCTELDLAGDKQWTGWYVCYDCGAREWDGQAYDFASLVARTAEALLAA